MWQQDMQSVFLRLVLMGSKIKDAVGNDYGRPRDVVGENRYAFTTHADSAFDVCFENIVPDSKDDPWQMHPSRL